MLAQQQGGGVNGEPWKKNRWWLFGRSVESPHTTSFYVRKDRADGYDWDEAAQYWYNGRKVPSSPEFTKFMEEAAKIVEVEVNKVLKTREKNELEWRGIWRPNVAAANCYKGSKESVGPHSDQLTYLGPYPTIASLTLGVERNFRLRSQVPTSDSSFVSATARTYNLPLPHNSLLIMHAGCQENFKHSVPEMRVVDTFKLGDKTYTERINACTITFRFYRPDFAPSPSPSTPSTKIFNGTPKCKCDVPCILRPDARYKAQRNMKVNGDETDCQGAEKMLFFWQCYGGAAKNQDDGCGFFKILDMKGEGRGRWFDGA
ncbi:hypothetical protein BT69DRAFT_1242913 [Atractiella rhizophila]|nr:hypothetical protein BT69DRAFT_1242913 [Atractiella rhizophila]